MFLSRKKESPPAAVRGMRRVRPTSSTSRRHAVVVMQPNEERARFAAGLERSRIPVTLCDSLTDLMKKGATLPDTGALVVDHALVGPEIFQAIQQMRTWPTLRNSIPVVITHRCSQALLVAGIARGVGQFIERPAQVRDVVERVERVLRKLADEVEESGVYLTRR